MSTVLRRPTSRTTKSQIAELAPRAHVFQCYQTRLCVITLKWKSWHKLRIDSRAHSLTHLTSASKVWIKLLRSKHKPKRPLDRAHSRAIYIKWLNAEISDQVFQGDNNMDPDDFFANFWDSLFNPTEGNTSVNGELDYDDELELFGKLYNWFDLIQIQFRERERESPDNGSQRPSHKEKARHLLF